jgi:hypothetical protein
MAKEQNKASVEPAKSPFRIYQKYHIEYTDPAGKKVIQIVEAGSELEARQQANKIFNGK